MTNNEFNMKLSSYSGGTLWFKIHLFFIIPLNIIMNTASLIMFITQLYSPEMHRAYLINPNRMILISGITIIVSLVIIGIYAYSFYNLRCLTLNGYKVYLTFMLINLVLKNIIITVSTLAESNIILPIVIQSVSIMLIFTIIQIGIWWIPNYIYFKKRKSLFSNVSPAPIPKQNIQQIENFKNVSEINENSCNTERIFPVHIIDPKHGERIEYWNEKETDKKNLINQWLQPDGNIYIMVVYENDTAHYRLTNQTRFNMVKKSIFSA